MNAALFEGAEVQLGAMLAAREARMAAQHGLIKKHNLPVVLFTLNIPGPVKRFALADMLFDSGVDMINRALLSRGIAIADGITRRCETGCEYIAAIDGDAYRAKAALTALEESFPAARLFDMDVITNEFEHISRADIGMQPRRCFLCSAPAAECARSRRHTLDELTDHVHTLLWQWYADAQAERIGRTAQRAMLYELAATPKPGLVDRRNNGAHTDMDFYTFIDSACITAPYFAQCAREGLCGPADYAELFARLKMHGLKAESDMLGATGGVNTHKGEIFSLGLISAAWARLIHRGVPVTAGSICKTAADIFASAVPDAHGLSGARLSAHGGFALALNTALPILRREAQNGMDTAACAALTALMAQNEDTNIVRRAGEDGLEYVKQLCTYADTADADTLMRMDDELIRRNISPGGSADLLAAALMLYFAENDL